VELIAKHGKCPATGSRSVVGSEDGMQTGRLTMDWVSQHLDFCESIPTRAVLVFGDDLPWDHPLETKRRHRGLIAQ
jgi:hypothetical protein